MDIDPEKIIHSPFFPGFFGAVASLKWVPGASFLERLVNSLIAWSMAGFLSPAIAQYFKMSSPEMQGATAFATGFFGLNLAALGFRWLSSLQLSDLLPWRSKKD